MSSPQDVKAAQVDSAPSESGQTESVIDQGSQISTTSTRTRRRNRNRRRGGNGQLQRMQQQQQQQQPQYYPPPQQMMQQMPQQQVQEGGGKKNAASLRLDLNLEAEVVLTARVHGDVTLALFN